MELTLEAVISVFLDVLEGRMTREAADRWAYAARRELESGTLTFKPPEEEDRIRKGVRYLHGVDLQYSPGEYFYDEDWLREAMEETVGKN